MSKKQMSLEVINPNAAGIDIGSRSHWVAVGQNAQDVKEFGVYLQAYHMLPFARVSEFIEDLTGHHISQGSFANFQRKCYHNLENYEHQIKKLLLQTTVLHADETGIRQNGSKDWFHVLSSKYLSFFGYHPKRGKEAIDDFNIIAKYKGNLVHDRFSSYFSYNCKHSLCNAHILRELNFIEESKDAQWAKEIKDILIKSHRKRKYKKLKEKYYNKELKKFEEIIKPIIDNYNPIYKKT